MLQLLCTFHTIIVHDDRCARTQTHTYIPTQYTHHKHSKLFSLCPSQTCILISLAKSVGDVARCVHPLSRTIVWPRVRHKPTRCVRGRATFGAPRPRRPAESHLSTLLYDLFNYITYTILYDMREINYNTELFNTPHANDIAFL